MTQGTRRTGHRNPPLPPYLTLIHQYFAILTHYFSSLTYYFVSFSCPLLYLSPSHYSTFLSYPLLCLSLSNPLLCLSLTHSFHYQGVRLRPSSALRYEYIMRLIRGCKFARRNFFHPCTVANQDPVLANNGVTLRVTNNTYTLRVGNNRATLRVTNNRGTLQVTNNKATLQVANNRATLRVANNRGTLHVANNRATLRVSNTRATLGNANKIYFTSCSQQSNFKRMFLLAVSCQVLTLFTVTLPVHCLDI